MGGRKWEGKRRENGNEKKWGKPVRELGEEKKWGEEMGVGRVWCLGGEKKSVGV